MEKAITEKLRQELLQLKAALLEDQQSSRESTSPVVLDQTTVGRLTRMDAMQGQQMALETARRRQHLLLRVEGALRNIESDEYGYCFICSEEIDIRRLQADPTNSRCIKCAHV